MYKKYPNYKLLNSNYVCRIGKDLNVCSKNNCKDCRHYVSTIEFFSNVRGENEGDGRNEKQLK